jgi:hypothetical protein
MWIEKRAWANADAPAITIKAISFDVMKIPSRFAFEQDACHFAI